jgi:stress-induced morphogen
MAKVASLTKSRLKKLEAAVLTGMDERQIRTESVSLLKSGLAGRFRLVVVSPDFELLPDGERQSIIWGILKENWERSDQLRLTLCLGLTPAESRGEI